MYFHIAWNPMETVGLANVQKDTSCSQDPMGTIGLANVQKHRFYMHIVLMESNGNNWIG